MGIKDIFIIVLIIALVGAILFGSFGNFLGMITGVMNGVSDTVSNSEGYVYRGGYIDSYPVSDSSSQGSVVDGSGSDSSSSAGNLLSSNAGSSGYSDGSSGSSSSSGSGSQSSSSSSGVVYEDYQRDYETGMVDEGGNPIYLSIVSTSGGQMDPGIYQVYWSTLGPINQTKIG